MMAIGFAQAQEVDREFSLMGYATIPLKIGSADLGPDWRVTSAGLSENLLGTWGKVSIESLVAETTGPSHFFAEYYDAQQRRCFVLAFSSSFNEEGRITPMQRSETKNYSQRYRPGNFARAALSLGQDLHRGKEADRASILVNLFFRRPDYSNWASAPIKQADTGRQLSVNYRWGSMVGERSSVVLGPNGHNTQSPNANLGGERSLEINHKI